MVLGKQVSHMQKNETEPLPLSIAQINLTWIKDLNLRPQTIKFLEENPGSPS